MKFKFFLKYITFYFCLSVLTNPLLAGELTIRFEPRLEALESTFGVWLHRQFSDNKIAEQFLQDALENGDITVIFTENLKNTAHFDPMNRIIRVDSTPLLIAFKEHEKRHNAKSTAASSSTESSLGSSQCSSQMCQTYSDYYRDFSNITLSLLLFELGNSLNNALQGINPDDYDNATDFAYAMETAEAKTYDIIENVYTSFHKPGQTTFAPYSDEERAGHKKIEINSHFKNYERAFERHMVNQKKKDENLKKITAILTDFSSILKRVKTESDKEQLINELNAVIKRFEQFSSDTFNTPQQKDGVFVKFTTDFSIVSTNLITIKKTILELRDCNTNADLVEYAEKLLAMMMSISEAKDV